MSDDPEIRFTPSRDFCPHPEYWHSPDSEATETEVSEFIGSLVRLVQPEFVVETGAYKGHTTIEINYALNLNGHGRGVSVEADSILADEARRRVANRFGGNPRMVVINVNSMEYEPVQDIDLAFFDSWQEGRHLEFLRYYSMGRIKPGAIVAFHDTAPHHLVRNFVLPLEGIGEGQIKMIDFHTPRGLIVGQVQ
jgi:predicted O-methyltransferase YrrM